MIKYHEIALKISSNFLRILVPKVSDPFFKSSQGTGGNPSGFPVAAIVHPPRRPFLNDQSARDVVENCP